MGSRSDLMHDGEGTIQRSFTGRVIVRAGPFPARQYYCWESLVALELSPRETVVVLPLPRGSSFQNPTRMAMGIVGVV
jgi:hypothetical protein